MNVSSSDLFLKIRLHPAADLTRLEEVLVITKMQDVAPASDLASSQRTVDILAARLPGVPDKPTSPDSTHTDASGATVAPGTAATGTATPGVEAGAGGKPVLSHAAKPQDHEPQPPPNSPGPQAKPTHEPKLTPAVKPVSQRMP